MAGRGQNGLDKAVATFVRKHMRNRKDRRTHLTLKPNLDRKKFRGLREQRVDGKPLGLWYGFGDSWIEWCQGEQPDWLTPYIYEIVLREDKIFKVNGEGELDKFEETYAIPDPLMAKFANEPLFKSDIGRYDKIDYNKLVAEGWYGLEINPYLWSRRLSRMWYYGWDCASGCVWNKRGVVDIRLFGRYDPDSGEFVKCTNRPAGRV